MRGTVESKMMRAAITNAGELTWRRAFIVLAATVLVLALHRPAAAPRCAPVSMATLDAASLSRSGP